ncbi:ABC transporter substrate-binding protein [Eubacteriales bacterium OttesenSCG-928-N13]|nr:ABC transporter substrate-binding protein [Eubacteriales bacterium OttesenSCG-928-N13]
MTKQKFLSLLLALVMVLGVAGSAMADEVTQLPRNESLYFAGQQWGPVNSWNPIGVNQNNAMATTTSPQGSRTIMFETLYMYNFMDGSMTPLLAEGDYVWNDSLTEMTVKLNPAAKWSDGTAVTAEDVAATWNVAATIQNNTATNYSIYIDGVEAVDAQTVLIKSALTEAGTPVNPLKVVEYLGNAFVAQKAWIETVCARNNDDATAILNDAAEDVVWSGPYTKYVANDQQVVLVRDDNYWGQDASMWGSLPVPKYIVHTIFADNPAGETAFKAGEVDVCQQFLPNIQDLWLKDGLPISTYIEDAPYQVCLTMPTAWYNMKIEALQNPVLRKAIAIAVDYDSIIANAMTNQSPTFADVPRSMMNPTAGEQALYNHDQVKDLQWIGNDIEGAKAMLDEAGIVDTDGDGWRELNGEKIALNACCPNGWTDWQAAMEIVADAGKNIGVEITTLFPEWSIYQTVFTNPNQTEYQIFMYSPDSAGPAQPWGRVRQFMGGDLIGIENNWTGNYGQYTNARVDEILAAIPQTTDEAELNALYTEAVEIYLTEVPSFSLMYRPAVFHEVNESVWTNYPDAEDGRNIPPADCTDGYGIAALYELELVNP